MCCFNQMMDGTLHGKIALIEKMGNRIVITITAKHKHSKII